MIMHVFNFILDRFAGNCTHGESRLQNGMNSTSGRVEVCVDGQWQTVCDKHFDSTTAGVFCKSLGLNLNSELSIIIMSIKMVATTSGYNSNFKV